jgi:hypothetical protein
MPKKEKVDLVVKKVVLVVLVVSATGAVCRYFV